MRRVWFGLIALAGVALSGCGGIDKSIEVPKEHEPMPTDGPSAMSGPAAPPSATLPQ